MDAQSITLSLGGRWHGYSGNAPCPICQPERRAGQLALSLRQESDRLLIYCFKSGCDYNAIRDAIGFGKGVNLCLPPRWRSNVPSSTQANSDRAKELWEDSRQIGGTFAETYLLARGITCPLPASLRFHPRCWHKSGQHLPAMVAKLEGSGGFAVHRTYLLPDGSDKATVEPNKAMLGPCAGGFVRLSAAPGPLVVAEGIETALSLASGLLDAPGPIWAALSTSGMMALNLPADPGRIIIAPDGELAGRNAAVRLAERAYYAGWSVSILPIPDGADWNDILTGRAMP